MTRKTTLRGVGVLAAAAAGVVAGAARPAAAAPNESVNNQLLLLYDMENIAGGTIPDRGGAVANNGTISNPSTPVAGTGKFGSGLQLTSPTSTTGTNVTIPKAGDLAVGTSITNQLTVSLWLNATTTGATGTNNSVFDSANDGYAIFASQTTVAFKITNAANTAQNVRTNVSTNIFGAGWVHLVGTYDGNAGGAATSLWVNGVKATTDVIAPNTNPPTSSAYSQIRDQDTFLNAAGPANTNTLMNGVMDDVAVWNRVLTDEEVLYLYNGGTGNPVPEPGTIALLGSAGIALLTRRRRPAAAPA